MNTRTYNMIYLDMGLHHSPVPASHTVLLAGFPDMCLYSCFHHRLVLGYHNNDIGSGILALDLQNHMPGNTCSSQPTSPKDRQLEDN